jgi:hypothetical protein
MPTLEDVAKQPRAQRLERMARTADDYTAAIRGQSDGALSRRPDEKNWAAKEVICHMRDTEERFGMLFESILVMDDPRMVPVNPDRWAEERQYLRNDGADALAAFRKRREESLAKLKSLTPEQWQRGAVHPARGRMTFEDFVTLMTWHDDNHLDQLTRALAGKA